MKNSAASFFFLFFTVAIGFSQQDVPFERSEEVLASYSAVFLDIRTPDSVKENNNRLFIEQLEEMMRDPASVSYSFTRLKNISVLDGPDGLFRIFTWFTVHPAGYRKHGLIQAKMPKSKSVKVTVLEAMDELPRSISYKTLDAGHWLGAVYYDMIPAKIKGKSYYVLLGFDGNDGMVHRKVIDVLTLNQGIPKFGSGIFFARERMASRVIFQYSAQAKMSLSYDEKSRMITFDRLVPSRQGMEEQYQFYGPSFAYDAYRYEGGKWVLKTNVDARNETENLGQQGKKYDLLLPENGD